jgi:hypothetical protein
MGLHSGAAKNVHTTAYPSGNSADLRPPTDKYSSPCAHVPDLKAGVLRLEPWATLPTVSSGARGPPPGTICTCSIGYLGDNSRQTHAESTKLTYLKHLTTDALQTPQARARPAEPDQCFTPPAPTGVANATRAAVIGRLHLERAATNLSGGAGNRPRRSIRLAPSWCGTTADKSLEIPSCERQRIPPAHTRNWRSSMRRGIWGEVWAWLGPWAAKVTRTRQRPVRYGFAA